MTNHTPPFQTRPGTVEPRPLRQGQYWLHRSPSGTLTFWQIESLVAPNRSDCIIVLLGTSREGESTGIPKGGRSYYERETIETYELWQPVSDEDAPLVLLSLEP